MPNKGGSNRQGGWKKFRNLINGGGVKINGEVGVREKGVNDIQEWKEQKQIVIKHKTKIYTAERYFAMKSWRNYY